MKTKTTEWKPEEDAALARAVRDKISTARLAVRLQRTEGSIKRRIRDLGLNGTAPKLESKTNPAIQARRFLAACRSKDLSAAMAFYAEDATLECACTGPAVYAGFTAIMQYWAPKIASNTPGAFSLVAVRSENDRVVLDYLSYEAKPVRMYISLDTIGLIAHSQCGPNVCTKQAA